MFFPSGCKGTKFMRKKLQTGCEIDPARQGRKNPSPSGRNDPASRNRDRMTRLPLPSMKPIRPFGLERGHLVSVERNRGLTGYRLLVAPNVLCGTGNSCHPASFLHGNQSAAGHRHDIAPHGVDFASTRPHKPGASANAASPSRKAQAVSACLNSKSTSPRL